MEMCPYCGEEVPDNSAKCWECGTELSTSGAAVSEGDDDASAEASGAEGKTKKSGGAPAHGLELCPHCEAPLPKKALRCKECGRTVRALEGPSAAETVGWKLGTWGVFVGVALLVVGVIAIAAWPSGQGERREVAGSFAEIRQILKSRPAEAEQKFLTEYHGKYVRWQGQFVSLTGQELVLKCGTDGNVELRVRVTLSADAQAKATAANYAPNAAVAFTGQLVGFEKEGFVFLLENGSTE